MATTTWYAGDDRRDRAANRYDDAFELTPDERIGAPLASRRLRQIGKALVGASLVAFAGSAILDDQSTARWVWLTAHDTARPYFERAMQTSAAPVATAPPVDTASVAAPPIEPAAEQSAADPAVSPAILPVPTARREEASSTAPDEPAATDERPPPLPKPQASDPLQKRALAVGLHPDVSRALLARMSETDFRNAGVAIRTALAETAEGDELIWPRQPVKGQARFRVSFVRGASEACRRYVVAIATDGWLTTAPAMEKCPEPGKQARVK